MVCDRWRVFVADVATRPTGGDDRPLLTIRTIMYVLSGECAESVNAKSTLSFGSERRETLCRETHSKTPFSVLSSRPSSRDLRLLSNASIGFSSINKSKRHDRTIARAGIGIGESDVIILDPNFQTDFAKWRFQRRGILIGAKIVGSH